VTWDERGGGLEPVTGTPLDAVCELTESAEIAALGIVPCCWGWESGDGAERGMPGEGTRKMGRGSLLDPGGLPVGGGVGCAFAMLACAPPAFDFLVDCEAGRISPAEVVRRLAMR
jgi:hypothetical protein